MTAALEGVSGQQHAPTALYPRERPSTHHTGGWVGPRAGLDGRKIYIKFLQDDQKWENLSNPSYHTELSLLGYTLILSLSDVL